MHTTATMSALATRRVTNSPLLSRARTDYSLQVCFTDGVISIIFELALVKFLKGPFIYQGYSLQDSLDAELLHSLTVFCYQCTRILKRIKSCIAVWCKQFSFFDLIFNGTHTQKRLPLWLKYFHSVSRNMYIDLMYATCLVLCFPFILTFIVKWLVSLSVFFS